MDSDELARLMTEQRPLLHRYCARMVGSAFDAEDIVQEALANAMESRATAGELKNPAGWLFRIAHNGALDLLRRRKRHDFMESDEALLDLPDAAAVADSHVAASASLATLLHLPVIQRSTVVLADVLGHSLAETAEFLGVSLPAAKSALHRGRGRLEELGKSADESLPALDESDRRRLRDYADRFNARDFDALRGLLSEEVRLDLVNRTRLAGRKDVSAYFTHYERGPGVHLSPGWAENRPALLVRHASNPAGEVDYIVLLDWVGERIATIRDFRFAPYIMESLTTTHIY